jgi:hypothetical protein
MATMKLPPVELSGRDACVRSGNGAVRRRTTIGTPEKSAQLPPCCIGHRNGRTAKNRRGVDEKVLPGGGAPTLKLDELFGRLGRMEEADGRAAD